MISNSHSYKKRPYTIINCAMSLDGKLALPSGKPITLSSPEDFKRTHELRNYCDAVLVGINTVLLDDPKLTVKPEFVDKPKNPTRIILDTRGRTPENAHVLDGSAPTYIVMSDKFKGRSGNFKNVEVIYCATNKSGNIKLEELLLILKNNGIENLLVEGGQTVIYNFLKNQLVNEVYVYISNVIIGGTSGPTLAGGKGAKSAEDIITLRLLSCERLGEGVLLKYLA
jgi:2,5-diamino-6-(ribosylamino)-4(3H)-pyrimidinone 5'-phosphate reductase